jgi:hypothetical protein
MGLWRRLPGDLDHYHTNTYYNTSTFYSNSHTALKNNSVVAVRRHYTIWALLQSMIYYTQRSIHFQTNYDI